MNYQGRALTIAFHDAAIAALPDEFVNGRNLRDGYIRGAGAQFGNLARIFGDDRALGEANMLAKLQNSALDDAKLISLYVMVRFCLPLLGSGHIAEFGVHKGGSALFMARLAQTYLPDAKVYCFDSFCGMPATSSNDLHKEGDFNDPETHLVTTALKYGIDNIVIVKGMFSDTMARCADIGPLLLAHYDGDLYQSIVDSYEGSRAYIVPRGYMVFDDAIAASCIGAFDAISEYVIRRDGLNAEQNWPHMVFRK